MKNIKLLTFAVIPLAVFGSTSQAGAFVTNFDSYSVAPVAGQGGWIGSTSAATYATIDPGYIDPSNQLVLGYANGVQPSETTVTVGNSGYNQFLAGTQAVFDFRIIDQIGTNVAADRYGFNLTAGAGTLSVYLSPTTSLGGLARWELGYSVNGGTYTKFVEDINVFESNVWNFSLAVTANSNPLLSNVAVTITGASSATGFITGAALNPTANVSNFGFAWDKSGASFTDNYIAIDNLSVVPEPSSALLLGCAGLGLMVRRRRA